MTEYLLTFEHQVGGIPCQVAVTHATPYIPAQTFGPPENCYPAEGGDCEWVLLDRKGYRAKWLEKKLTEKELEEIDELCFTKMESLREEKSYD